MGFSRYLLVQIETHMCCSISSAMTLTRYKLRLCAGNHACSCIRRSTDEIRGLMAIFSRQCSRFLDCISAVAHWMMIHSCYRVAIQALPLVTTQIIFWRLRAWIWRPMVNPTLRRGFIRVIFGLHMLEELGHTATDRPISFGLLFCFS